jgi:hypothetical protein
LLLSSTSTAQIVVGRLGAMPSAPAVQISLSMPDAPALPGPALFSPSPLAPTLSLVPSPVALIAAVPVAIAAVSPITSVVAARPAFTTTGARAAAARERIAELKAAFDERKPEAVLDEAAAAPLALQTLQTARPDTLAASAPEPPEPAKPARAGGVLGLSRPLVFFLLALVVAQVGVEAQTAAIPLLVAKVFGNVSLAAQVGMASSLTELVGTVLAPIASKRLGLKRAYLWSTGLRVVAGGVTAGLVAAGWLSLGGLVALFALDSLLLGVSFTTEKSIPAVMVDQDQAKLERYKAARQTAIEAVATLAPIATGAVVAALGFVPALVAFPVALALSMTLVGLTLKLPAKLAGLKGADLPGPDPGSLRAFFKSLGRGASKIARTPALLFSLLAYSFVYAPTSLIYWLIAPAYAVHLAGPGAEQAATAYSGMITGLYSLGAIAGSLMMMRGRALDGPAMRRSMLRWTAATAAALSLFLVLALPFWGWGTLTLPALALFFFGVPQVMAKLKLESYFQSRAPKGAVDDATAVLEGASSIVIAAGLWLFGKLLLGAHIVSSFWLAAAVGPLGLVLLLLCWALARASRPGR